MAFTNQTTTNLADFISKLNTFLSTNGWTTHHVPASGEWAARKTATGVDVACAIQWNTSSALHFAVYQWHGAAYNAGNSPWAQNNDSGNGAASTSNASIVNSRLVGNVGSPVQFWCFEEDYYFHVVVQTSATEFAHFGAGALEKFNDWTGGEYVYGHRYSGGISSDVAVQPGSSMMLDGYTNGLNMELFAATVHVEGMLNQPAGGLYGVVMGNQSAASLGQDRQGAPKDRVHLMGGFRAGPGVMQWGWFYGNAASGLMPGYPITIYHRDVLGGGPTNDIEGPLGRIKDVRGVNIRNYEPGDELTVGSDTWLVFPSYKKWPGTGNLTNTTAYQGIAYKKITP